MLKPSYPNLFALILGAFAVLGFAPFYCYPATILSLIGIIYLWAKAISPIASFKLGFMFGSGLYIVGIYWIYISLHDYGGMPWWFAGFCTFCLCAFLALFPAMVGYLSKHLGFLLVSAPVLWALSDWVRSWLFTGFPWLTIAYSQTPGSPYAGFMPIIGAYGASLLTVFVAACVAVWLANRQTFNPHWRRMTIAAVVILTGAGLLLKTVEWSRPWGKPLHVSLLQGNIAQDIKWTPDAAESSIKRYLEMVKASDAQLLILPETAFPVIASRLDSDVKQALTMHAIRNGGNIIVGMVEYNPVTQEYFNSALSYGKDATQPYRKNHLVPFGEFIPLKKLLGWIYRDWLHIPLSGISRGGVDQKPMQLSGQRVAINICYEDVFGEEIIRQLPEATLLVNISNDAWYGQSYAADQHMQFSQARALETGRMVLRSTNTGATAVIDQNGYVLAHAPHDIVTTLNATVQGYTGATPYVRWGNWPFIVISLGLLFWLFLKRHHVHKS